MATQLESGSGTAPLLGVFALVVSVLIHVVLIELNPNLLPGHADPSVPRARSYRHMQVQPPEPEALRQELPRLFEAENPSSAMDGRSGPDKELPEMDPSAGPGLVPDIESAVAPAPLADPDNQSSSESNWSPREEVLAITETRVRETLEVLPRAFREVEMTRPNAPDIVLPSERPEADLMETSPAPAFSSIPSAPAGIGSVEEVLGGLAPPQEPSPSISSGPPPELPSLDEPTYVDNEPMIATEQLLQLNVQVYDPPDEPDARYVKLQLRRRGIESLQAMPRDVVFLVDCSASMTEAKLQLALAGIRASLDAIDPLDRIQVIAFRDQVELFASEPKPATVFGKAQVRTFLSTLHAFGQTDVYASLEALQAVSPEPSRPVLAVVITDGVPTQGVMDTGKILDQFTRANRGRVSVFGLGGGDRVNRQLLDFLSFRNRGFSLISAEPGALASLPSRLLSELRRPVLTDVDVRFTGEVPPEVYPKSLSHLYVDRPWILIARTHRSAERMAFQVVGAAAEATHDIVFDLQVSEQPRGPASLQREWAWQAGLERWAEALEEGTSEALEEAAAFFRRYQLEVPDAYRN
jgi:hypothetical protein